MVWLCLADEKWKDPFVIRNSSTSNCALVQGFDRGGGRGLHEDLSAYQTTTAQVFISRDANVHSLDVRVGVVVHLQGRAGSIYNILTKCDTRLPLFLEYQRQTSHRPGNPSRFHQEFKINL